MKLPIHSFCLARALTNITEEYRQEDEAMTSTKYNDAQIHAEVEDLEKLRLGEAEHDDSTQFGEGDATQHLKTGIGLLNESELSYLVHNTVWLGDSKSIR